MNLWNSKKKKQRLPPVTVYTFHFYTLFYTFYILINSQPLFSGVFPPGSVSLPPYVQMCRVGCSSWNNFAGDNHLASIRPQGKELLPESGLIRKINMSLPAGSSGFYSRRDPFFFLLLTRTRLCWQECDCKSARRPAGESFLREGYGFNSCLFVRQRDYTRNKRLNFPGTCWEAGARDRGRSL